MEHKLYYYNMVRGLNLVPCAKCLCGAELKGQEEIIAHMQEVEDGA